MVDGIKTVTFNGFQEHFEELQCKNACNGKLQEQFFDFIPSLFNYEEEGEKLTFEILFIENFKTTRKKIPTFLFKKLISVDVGNLNIRKHIKSIAPFSRNNWGIFISVESGDTYSIGIYKDFSGVEGSSLPQILKNEYIRVEKVDKDILFFENFKHSFYLHLSVTARDISRTRKEDVLDLVDATTECIDKTSNLEAFKKSLSDFLFQAFEKIHGTIIVVVHHEDELDQFFKHGILLEEPINLFTEFENQELNDQESDLTKKSYYSFMGFLSVAIDIDGLTILNNKAEVIGYNVFIDNDKSKVDTSGVSGGARKRAAYSIEKSNISGVTGMYFQSHDGGGYFQELGNE